MKSTSAACLALLNSSRQVFMVELYTLTLLNGTVILWANSDKPASYSGTTWNRGPIIERAAIKQQVGLDVQTCSVSIYADDTITILGVPLLRAARRGMLDGARLLIQKGFTSDPLQPLAGLVHRFEGRVGDIKVNGQCLTCTVKDDTILLDTMIPLHSYQPSCLRTLYDTGCGVNKAANGLTLTVQTGSTASVLQCAVTGTGTYDLGILAFVSGSSAGVQRAVKAQTPGQIVLSYPLIDPPTVGDQFIVYKGCDKTLATCTSKFSNQTHFKGQPYVPKPETAF